MARISLLLTLVCLPVLGQPLQEPGIPQTLEDGPARQEVEIANVAALIEALQTTVDYLSRQEAAINYGDDYAREGLVLQRLDLGAQSSMASSSKWMVIWALVGVVISGVGVVLLIHNIGLTRQIIRADRAWLSVRYEAPSEVIGNPDNPEFREYGFALENTGKTPAVRYQAIIHYEKAPCEINAAGIIEEMRKSPASFLAPDEKIYRKWRMNKEMLREFANENIEWAIYICCEYQTIYGEKFMIEQAYRTEKAIVDGRAYINFVNRGDRSHIVKVNEDGSFTTLE